MPLLGLIELIFIGVFFVLMVVGTSLDRRYNESPKWWFLGIALAIAVVYFWGQIDFTTVLAAVQTWDFWKPFVVYLIAGVAYSALEFVLAVRKMARSHATSWDNFMNTVAKRYFIAESGVEIEGGWVHRRGDKLYVPMTQNGNIQRDGEFQKEVNVKSSTYRETFKSAQTTDSVEAKTIALKMFASYISSDQYRASDLRKDFIRIELDDETFEVATTIDRGRLASFIGAWTFLWPAYAVSLLLGDFLVEVFRVIGDFFSKIGGRFVRMSFEGVFKI